MKVNLKSIYDPPEKKDGLRILVDRLWPGSVNIGNEEKFLWMKDIAPSDKLYNWYSNNEERWEAFRDGYEQELEKNTECMSKLYVYVKKNRVTLITATQDRYFNHARILADYLNKYERYLQACPDAEY